MTTAGRASCQVLFSPSHLPSHFQSWAHHRLAPSSRPSTPTKEAPGLWFLPADILRHFGAVCRFFSALTSSCPLSASAVWDDPFLGCFRVLSITVFACLAILARPPQPCRSQTPTPTPSLFLKKQRIGRAGKKENGKTKSIQRQHRRPTTTTTQNLTHCGPLIIHSTAPRQIDIVLFPRTFRAGPTDIVQLGVDKLADRRLLAASFLLTTQMPPLCARLLR